MARRGVWELNEVILRYCAHGGSSGGVRQFVEKNLAGFAAHNPQISFKTTIRGGHPCVYGKYSTYSAIELTITGESDHFVSCSAGSFPISTDGTGVPFINRAS